MSVFWLRHPRFRLIYAICIATIFIGKLGANYHFVSDLIAGGFLGFSVGLIIIALRNAGTRQKSTVPPRCAGTMVYSRALGSGTLVCWFE
jgi:hypothetical protein